MSHVNSARIHWYDIKPHKHALKKRRENVDAETLGVSSVSKRMLHMQCMGLLLSS